MSSFLVSYEKVLQSGCLQLRTFFICIPRLVSVELYIYGSTRGLQCDTHTTRERLSHGALCEEKVIMVCISLPRHGAEHSSLEIKNPDKFKRLRTFLVNMTKFCLISGPSHKYLHGSHPTNGEILLFENHYMQSTDYFEV